MIFFFQKKGQNKFGVTDLLSCLKGISQKRGNGEDNITNINQWIQKSLLNHTLSGSLVVFANVKNRIKNYYYRMLNFIHFSSVNGHFIPGHETAELTVLSE